MSLDIAPGVLSWARERAGVDPAALEARFPALPEWERGTAAPTFIQLQQFAKATHAPIGYLLLPEPPVEPLPIPDFRTFRDTGVHRPSADLLDQIYLVEQRQEWYREHQRAVGTDVLDFVGSVTTDDEVVKVAARIAARIRFTVQDRARYRSWSEALRDLIDLIEDTGVLVMISGVVGANTHRALDPQEFRGFALADPLAPVIFVNGKDSKAAQIFTLLHELVHIWVGESALSDAALAGRSANADERFCNAVAAEILVPLESLRQEWDRTAERRQELDRMAARFRVSTLVVLSRVFDLGGLAWDEYQDWYAEEVAYVLGKAGAKTSEGGNYYNSAPFQMSRRFARAVIADTLEGRTLHRDAFQMLGFRKAATFTELGKRLGVA
ncbi:ImmA/IrrE family metallo-endopeptidase [Curtobacterium flaccumfaciens]|uniref:ImmA/IrrE family metallo-endopeptidase n=1 Tax=Curtobacterium flaccumfaciens TaxID=2035 RepID=UPI001BDF431B|nr:ImmA/IrrE family metallo-endopeptidase [Curtobacterium flaccumfaciens]MBT1633287.1 ImmA/IrrE family metallo-endopeptidase [Curtobacterium flaccumfaciens pv. oortii]MCX2846934.1 ImmA/IrrE family metallo-endopeptidase [Curtobacterium flaccumfaciens pv. oortii]